MNSYAIIRAISAIESMTYAEKFAGAILALHLNRKDGEIKVRQQIIADECGLSIRVVKSAIKKMIEAGVLIGERRGNSAMVLRPQDSVNISVSKKVDLENSKSDKGKSKKNGKSKVRGYAPPRCTGAHLKKGQCDPSATRTDPFRKDSDLCTDAEWLYGRPLVQNG